MVRSLALILTAFLLALVFIRPSATSAPAPAQSSCVACHTSRAALEPLVKPLPPAPAEGEG